MVETHFPVARINNNNLSVDKSASRNQMLSVSGTNTSRRVTISVRHVMKLLVTIIDSQRINVHRSREIRTGAAKLFRYANIPFSPSYPARYVCYAYKRSTAAAPRQSCLIISPWPRWARPFVEHTYFSHPPLCLNTLSTSFSLPAPVNLTYAYVIRVFLENRRVSPAGPRNHDFYRISNLGLA